MPEKFYIDDAGGSGGKNKFLIFMIAILIVAIIGAGAFLLLQKKGNSNDSNSNSSINAENSNARTTNNANGASGNSNATNAVQNENVNAALNANAANANANTAGNLNVITNLFPNTNGNTNASLNINAIGSSRDSDTDGLTDIEEALFGTNLSTPDSDADGYQDGQEVASGYDPSGGTTIEQGSVVLRFTNAVGGYSVLYPQDWDVASDPQSQYGMMFSSTNGEFIEVSIDENPAQLTARDWYLTKSPGINSAQVISVTTWDENLTGVKSPDGLTVYFTKGSDAYVIAYNTNILTEANFKTTFEMIYKSFKVVESASTNSNTNSNTNTNTNLNTNANTNSNTNANTNSTPRL